MECPICGKNLDQLGTDQRNQHVNRCLDGDSGASAACSVPSSTAAVTSKDPVPSPSSSQQSACSSQSSLSDTDSLKALRLDTDSRTKDGTGQSLTFEISKRSSGKLCCPFCSSEGPQTFNHFKTCANRNGVAPKDLLIAWRTHKDQSELADRLQARIRLGATFCSSQSSSVGSKAETTSRVNSSHASQSISKQVKKPVKSKRITSFFSRDEVNLAKALSLSEAESNGIIIKNGKVKTKEVFILPERSESERKMWLEMRISEEISSNQRILSSKSQQQEKRSQDPEDPCSFKETETVEDAQIEGLKVPIAWLKASLDPTFSASDLIAQGFDCYVNIRSKIEC